MRKTSWLAAVLFGVCALVCSAKTDRITYLKTRVPEAADICRSRIIFSSKDPDSLKFGEHYFPTFNDGLLVRNWIDIHWEVMAKNTFGAVLRHEMICEISCKQGKLCIFEGLKDKPY